MGHNCWIENPKLKKDKLDLYTMDVKTKIMEKSGKKSKIISIKKK